MKKASGDPRPVPPRQPEPEDCCRSGCTPCVFDLYESALQRYERELLAWEKRQQPSNEKPARKSYKKPDHRLS